MNKNNMLPRQIAKNALQALYAHFMAFLPTYLPPAVDFDKELRILCDLIARRVDDSKEISFCLHIGGARFNEAQFAASDFPRAHFESTVDNAVHYGFSKNPDFMAQFDSAALWRAQRFLQQARRAWAQAAAF